MATSGLTFKRLEPNEFVGLGTQERHSRNRTQNSTRVAQHLTVSCMRTPGYAVSWCFLGWTTEASKPHRFTLWYLRETPKFSMGKCQTAKFKLPNPDPDTRPISASSSQFHESYTIFRSRHMFPSDPLQIYKVVWILAVSPTFLQRKYRVLQ